MINYRRIHRMGISTLPIFLALIPARKGSKGVSGKNTRVVGKKALIEYTIQSALAVEELQKVFVSSDDCDVQRICKQYPVTFIDRPPDIATDQATANEVIEHFIKKLPRQFQNKMTFILYLQPTSPLRTEEHIKQAIRMLYLSEVRSVISLTKLNKPIFKCFSIDQNGLVASLFDEKLTNASRQDLPQVYIPNGAIYAFSVDDFQQKGMIPSNGSSPLIMDKMESLDIDSEEDFEVLENYLVNQTRSDSQ